MTNDELNRKVAELRGLWVYHYDKDYRENQYYVLVDQELNAVVPFDGRLGIRTGYRASEAEAWADVPDYCEDPKAWAMLFTELTKETGVAINRPWLSVSYCAYVGEAVAFDPSPGRALALAYVASQERAK